MQGYSIYNSLVQHIHAWCSKSTQLDGTSVMVVQVVISEEHQEEMKQDFQWAVHMIIMVKMYTHTYYPQIVTSKQFPKLGFSTTSTIIQFSSHSVNFITFLVL